MEFYLGELSVNGCKNINQTLKFKFCNTTLKKDNNFKGTNVKAIYGPNGSGKSAIMTALYIYRRIIMDEDGLSDKYFSSLIHEVINKETNTMEIEITFLAYVLENHLPFVIRHYIQLRAEGNYVYISKEKISELKGNSIRDDKFRELISVDKGNITYLFGVDDLNNNRFHDFKNYIISYDKFIDVLSCPKDPRQANKIEAKYVELILDKAVFNYDVVLIDTSHVLDQFNVLTMDLVDHMLFLVTNDPLDLKNMRSLVSILNDVNYKNHKIILNESVSPFKKYFSLYDIKNVIGANIDYVISKDFYIKNIDNFIMSGKIITLDAKAPSIFAKDYTTLMQIITDIYNEGVK